MASGGARLNSGPAPDPASYSSLRKDWDTLPASGFAGLVPEWPLPDQSGREAELWDVYWRKPQAIIWDRNNQQIEVALHVRRISEVEIPDSPTALGTLVRQQMDALLLTIPAMNAAHILISSTVLTVSAPLKSARQTKNNTWLSAVSVEGA